MIDLFKIEHNI